jgi:hypothetical protein
MNYVMFIIRPNNFLMPRSGQGLTNFNPSLPMALPGHMSNLPNSKSNTFNFGVLFQLFSSSF